ncbi:MAG: cupin domain-containing protein [Salinirussus sp.]
MVSEIETYAPSEQELYIGRGRLTNLVAGPDEGVDSFSCVRVRFPPGQTSEMHAKEETMEVVYVLEGELTLRTDSEAHIVGSDSVVVIPKGVAHRHCNEAERDLVHLVLMTPPGPEEIFKERRRLADVEDDADDIP